jgi:sulfoxide reductase heme-binding subunit YedZ
MSADGDGRAASRVGRRLRSPYPLWLLLSLPAIYMAVAWWRGATFYGEVLHATGELATQLLIVTLAVTPLSLAFPAARWTRWLRARRRNFGVAAFSYSLLHAAVYLWRQDLARIVEDALEPAMWTGWLAVILLLALAMTSNDVAVRRLGQRWKRLHRVVYVAAVLTFAHWILSAFDPIPGWIHLGVLAALEAYRLWRTRINRAARSRA